MPDLVIRILHLKKNIDFSYIVLISFYILEKEYKYYVKGNWLS